MSHPNDTPSVADRVVALRKQAGSHDKLAAQLGTSRQRVIAWEQGGQPKPAYVKKLARLAKLPESAFQQSEEELLTLAALRRRLEELEELAHRFVPVLERLGPEFELIDDRVTALEKRSQPKRRKAGNG